MDSRRRRRRKRTTNNNNRKRQNRIMFHYKTTIRCWAIVWLIWLQQPNKLWGKIQKPFVQYNYHLHNDYQQQQQQQQHHHHHHNHHNHNHQQQRNHHNNQQYNNNNYPQHYQEQLYQDRKQQQQLSEYDLIEMTTLKTGIQKIMNPNSRGGDIKVERITGITEMMRHDEASSSPSASASASASASNLATLQTTTMPILCHSPGISDATDTSDTATKIIPMGDEKLDDELKEATVKGDVETNSSSPRLQDKRNEHFLTPWYTMFSPLSSSSSASSINSTQSPDIAIAKDSAENHSVGGFKGRHHKLQSHYTNNNNNNNNTKWMKLSSGRHNKINLNPLQGHYRYNDHEERDRDSQHRAQKQIANESNRIEYNEHKKNHQESSSSVASDDNDNINDEDEDENENENEDENEDDVDSNDYYDEVQKQDEELIMLHPNNDTKIHFHKNNHVHSDGNGDGDGDGDVPVEVNDDDDVDFEDNDFNIDKVKDNNNDHNNNNNKSDSIDIGLNDDDMSDRSYTRITRSRLDYDYADDEPQYHNTISDDLRERAGGGGGGSGGDGDGDIDTSGGTPGIITEQKYSEIGNEKAVQQARERYVQQQQENTKRPRTPHELATDHWHRMITATKCRKPMPRVIPISNNTSKRYEPYATILYRCGEDTGCCGSTASICTVKRYDIVTVYVFSYDFNYRKEIEALPMHNHTECHCVNRASLQMHNMSPSRGKRSGQHQHQHQHQHEHQHQLRLNDKRWRHFDILSKFQQNQQQHHQQQPYEEDDKISNCLCPRHFHHHEEMIERLAHLPQPHQIIARKCRCDCLPNDFICERYKRGEELFHRDDRKCISDFNCKPPVCLHGDYNSKLGKCPTVQSTTYRNSSQQISTGQSHHHQHQHHGHHQHHSQRHHSRSAINGQSRNHLEKLNLN